MIYKLGGIARQSAVLAELINKVGDVSVSFLSEAVLQDLDDEEQVQVVQASTRCFQILTWSLKNPSIVCQK
jgi:hypothetical protein